MDTSLTSKMSLLNTYLSSAWDSVEEKSTLDLNKNFANLEYAAQTFSPFAVSHINREATEFIDEKGRIEYIRSCAFYGDDSITQVSFPVCSIINSSAFYMCSDLSSLSFPQCLTINGSAFYGCSSITAADFPNCTKVGRCAFPNCTGLKKANFPVCSRVEGYAFNYCYRLSNVSFPLCSFVEFYAFTWCSSITEVDMPLCSIIDMGAFANCANLSKVNFPSCRAIYSGAFQECTSLESALFPLCTYLDSKVFSLCYSLSSVSFPLCSYIGTSAFGRCSELTSLEFPSCTEIGDSAFAYCTSLSFISIPVCISLGNSVFYSCTQLSKVIIGEENVATLGEDAFIGTPMSDSSLTGYWGSIYVADDLVSSYQVAGNWSNYADRIVGWAEINSHVVSFVDSDGTTVLETRVVDDGGYAEVPSNPTKVGYTFKYWTLDGSTEVDVASYSITENVTFVASYTAVASYTLSISISDDANDLTITRTSSSAYADTGALSSGSKIYKGDVLEIYYNGDVRSYSITNGSETVASGSIISQKDMTIEEEITVSGKVTVSITIMAYEWKTYGGTKDYFTVSFDAKSGDIWDYTTTDELSSGILTGNDNKKKWYFKISYGTTDNYISEQTLSSWEEVAGTNTYDAPEGGTFAGNGCTIGVNHQSPPGVTTDGSGTNILLFDITSNGHYSVRNYASFSKASSSASYYRNYITKVLFYISQYEYY